MPHAACPPPKTKKNNDAYELPRMRPGVVPGLVCHRDMFAHNWLSHPPTAQCHVTGCCNIHRGMTGSRTFTSVIQFTTQSMVDMLRRTLMACVLKRGC
jgi:hypothetical protein